MTANCGCSSDPHELWCSSNPFRPEAMDIGGLQDFTSQATGSVHPSKVVCVRHDDGTLQLVGSASVVFERGEFMLVLHPIGDRVG